MVNWNSKKLNDILWLGNAIALVILVNLLLSSTFFRVDLTEEKRFSIKEPSKKVLRQLDDQVYIEVYLEGELNPSFKRFQKSIQETLEELKVYSRGKIKYTFVNPMTARGQQAQNEFMNALASRGVQPVRVFDKKDGQRIEKIIFPGAIVSYGGLETPVTLLKGSTARTADERINQSLENIEYEFVNALYKLSNTARKQIGLVHGHHELDGASLESLRASLQELYEVSPVRLNDSLSQFNALIIAKPAQAFSPTEKFYLDQYVMNGGKVLFLLDKMEVNMDSASLDNYFAFPSAVNLDDQLFRYGVRLNMNLIQDRASALYPVVTGQVNGKPQLELMEWPFFPLINRYADHPITRNLDAIVTRFVSTLDTVKAEGVKKTPLLFTSPATRVVEAPVKVSVNDLRKQGKPEDFSSGFLPVAYLLEGSFTSYFKNKILPDGVAGPVKEHSEPTKLLVIADGDLAKNEVNPRSGQVQALGFDPFMNYTFANQELLLNAIAYLVDENGLIMARTKEIKIRPLNKERIASEKTTWQLINLVVPVLLLIGFGAARWYWRKNKYASF